MPGKLFRVFDTLLDRTIVLSYTRLGYTLRWAAWKDADLDVDLTGQVCLVTGASSGLGRVTAAELARRGATVNMLARDEGKGQRVRQAIIDRTGNANVHPEIADLSSLASVRALATRFFEHKSFNGVTAYAQAKRAQVILTELWAAKLAGSGVTVNAMHPGWADTPGVQTSLPTFRQLTRTSLRTPEQGADTIIWLAAAESVSGATGKFWFDRRERTTYLLPGTQSSAHDSQRLWDACMRLSGLADRAVSDAGS